MVQHDEPPALRGDAETTRDTGAATLVIGSEERFPGEFTAPPWQKPRFDDQPLFPDSQDD
jgi:hypothetical protein